MVKAVAIFKGTIVVIMIGQMAGRRKSYFPKICSGGGALSLKRGRGFLWMSMGIPLNRRVRLPESQSVLGRVVSVALVLES